MGRQMSALAALQKAAVLEGRLKPGEGSGTMWYSGEGEVCLPPLATLGLVRHSGPVGWTVAHGTRSRWSHAVMYVGAIPDANGVPTPSVLEARSNGAVVTPLAHVIADMQMGDITEFAWALDMPEFYEASSGSEGWLTEEEVRHQVAQIGLAMIGTPYSWAGIVAIALLQWHIRIKWATEYVRRLDEAFCSQLYAVACMGAGVDVGAKSRDGIWGISPGDLGRGRPLWGIDGKPLKDG